MPKYTYRLGGRELANAFVGRDLEGLRTELEFEQTIAASKIGLSELPNFLKERADEHKHPGRQCATKASL